MPPRLQRGGSPDSPTAPMAVQGFEPRVSWTLRVWHISQAPLHLATPPLWTMPDLNRHTRWKAHFQLGETSASKYGHSLASLMALMGDIGFEPMFSCISGICLNQTWPIAHTLQRGIEPRPTLPQRVTLSVMLQEQPLLRLHAHQSVQEQL